MMTQVQQLTNFFLFFNYILDWPLSIIYFSGKHLNTMTLSGTKQMHNRDHMYLHTSYCYPHSIIMEWQQLRFDHFFFFTYSGCDTGDRKQLLIKHSQHKCCSRVIQPESDCHKKNQRLWREHWCRSQSPMLFLTGCFLSWHNCKARFCSCPRPPAHSSITALSSSTSVTCSSVSIRHWCSRMMGLLWLFFQHLEQCSITWINCFKEFGWSTIHSLQFKNKNQEGIL